MLPFRTPSPARTLHRLATGGTFALLFTPCGCAFTDTTVRPPDASQLIAPSTLGRGREIALVLPFTDARPDRERCGMKKNGYNMDTADVYCAIPPARWVGMALADALVASGFRVILGTNGVSDSMPEVQVTLGQFFVEPKLNTFTVSPETDIGVALRVTTASGLVADRQFYVKGTEDAVFGTDDRLQSSADSATRAAVTTMVSALASILDRYPELGAPAVVGTAGALSMRAEDGRGP